MAISKKGEGDSTRDSLDLIAIAAGRLQAWL
jgi:hypothetical protein